MTARALALAAELGAAGLGAHVPGAVLRWWVAPWPALPTTRDEALQTAVGAGGALLVLYAGWAHTAHRATAPQVRGVAGAGVGFLLSAYASSSLRAYHVLGPTVSMIGVALVFRASLALVRERQDARAQEARAHAERDARRRGPPGA